jgi:hypothetical protein
MAQNWQPQLSSAALHEEPKTNGEDGGVSQKTKNVSSGRKKVVVVGLGMVGISFM